MITRAEKDPAVLTQPILVLGHGQLGLMLAAEAGRLGVDLDRLDLSSNEVLHGTSPRRLQVDEDFIFDHYATITAELEHLPETDLVKRIKASSRWANKAAFEQLVDRALQKQLLDELDLATSPWCVINRPEDLSVAIAGLGQPLVVKTTRGGYDGRGQWRITQDNLHQIPEQAFGHLIAESRIEFKREVSVIGVRSRSGQCRFLPLAENVHRDGILRYSLVRSDETAALAELGSTMLTALMTRLDYVGVMAMECFETELGLCINEIAPRVHNSGHWSQLGLIHNQFALHNLALLDLPLPEHTRHRATIMLNLIGCDFNPAWTTAPGVQVNWYGKSLRAGRKMGHLNIDASRTEELPMYAEKLRSRLDSEHAALLDEAIDAF